GNRYHNNNKVENLRFPVKRSELPALNTMCVDWDMNYTSFPCLY
ncbi:hypothetical protein FHG87_025177, partial [Trinorchestia longiramus]